jgi:hypothetical protein
MSAPKRAEYSGVIRLAAHRKRASRAPWILTIAFALLAGMFVIPASANASGGAFGCNAVTGRLGAGHYGEVNPDTFPCDNGYFGLDTLDLGIAQVTGLEAITSSYGNTAYASAATVAITVGRVHITIAAVQAKASAGCNWLHMPTVTSSSKVAGLRINGGLARVITGHVTINVLGLVVLELNKTTTVSTAYGKVRTQQALVLSSSTTPGKLVIGEATSGYYGNPCRVNPS